MSATMLLTGLLIVAALLQPALSCDDHDWTSPVLAGYVDHGLMKKHDLAKRIQPAARPAPPQKIKDLHWGQLNFLHTTDTHGWLAGHVLDDNYSADYGDFAGFVQKMKAKADVLGVDLLLIDSGDLHDGTGFGDATPLNGQLTLPIFDRLPYDLLSIGNHELYTTQIANDTYHTFAPRWGGRYVTSNVDFNLTGTPQPFSNRYAYWKSKQGVRIMAFAFIFNFTGNSNATVVTPVGGEFTFSPKDYPSVERGVPFVLFLVFVPPTMVRANEVPQMPSNSPGFNNRSSVPILTRSWWLDTLLSATRPNGD